MSLPPCLMKLEVADARHHINLWLPLFLAWIILGILVLALAPVVLLLALLFWPWSWARFLWKAGPTAYRLLCSLHDLRIDVNQKNEIVQIYFK